MCAVPARGGSLAELSLADSTFYEPYSYLRFVTDTAAISITDEEFFDQAGRVVFPVNKSELPAGDALLSVLSQKVIPQMNRDSLQLLRILLRGAASPEGPYLNNKRLGEARTAALLDFLRQHCRFPISDQVLSLQSETEDYRSLLLLMRRHGDRDYGVVARHCADCLPDGRYELLKQRLQRERGGALWRRLNSMYFPSLRCARFILVLRKYVPPTPPPPPPVVEPEPEPLPVPQPDTVTVRMARRELLAVKTNLLMYGVYMPGGYNRWCPMPNVAVEYFPWHGHFTFGASLDFPWWRDYGSHKFFEVRNYQVEARYYLRPADLTRSPAYRGFYVQGYAHGGLFEIGFNADKGWRGHGFGAGIGVGYVTPISRNGHWRLEFAVQVGWLTCKYDPFQYQNPVNPNYKDDLYYYKWTLPADQFRPLRYRFNWLGPTRVGITLSYDLLYRRIKKRGVSLRPSEDIELVRPCGDTEPIRERRAEP